MLRINLLPAYITERRKTRLAIVGFSVLFAVVTVGMIGWFITLSKQVSDMQADAQQQQALAGQVQAIDQDADRIRGSVAPIEAKTNFVTSVLFYNTLRPRIFRQVASYTYRDIEYSEMTIQGQTLTVKAWARNVSDVARFMMAMFANPDLSAVSISGIPGWPPTAQNAQGAGGEGGSGGSGGSGGPEFGSGGPPPGFQGGSGSGGSGGSGGEGGGAPGAAGGQGFNPYFNPDAPESAFPTPQVVRPPRPGFPFTVTASLIKPVDPPQPPGAGGGQGGPPGGVPGEMGSGSGGSSMAP